MHVSFTHFSKTRNAGDVMCSPRHYFDFGPDTSIHHITDPHESLSADVAIFGGGAVSGRLRMSNAHGKIKAKFKVAWGVGRSMQNHSGYPSHPAGFDLLGVRDYLSNMPEGLIYTPCVSCMHKAFDQSSLVTQDVIGIINVGKPVTIPGLPVIINNRAPMQDIINALSSANTVVTNSYHGAYWATLLGKKVIIVNAYSSKFHFMKFQPRAVTSSLDWRPLLRQAVAYPEALDDCRKTTLAFWDRVKDGMAKL